MMKIAGVVALTALAVAVPVTLVQTWSSDELPTAAVGEEVSLSDWRGGDMPDVGKAVRARAQLAYESFAGTVAQRDALAVVNAYAGNEAMDTCMAESGFPDWDWSLSRTYADPEDALNTSAWLEMPMGRYRSHDLVAAKPFLLAEHEMDADPDPESSAAVSSCLEQSDVQPSKAYGDAAEPLVERLKNQWWGYIADFDADRMPSYATYVTCMESADVTLMAGMEDTIESESFETAMGYAMSGASPPDASIPSDPDDPEQWANPDWQKFLSQEEEFDRADWGCRKDVYATFIEDLAPAIGAFADEHAEEIAEAGRYWQRVEERAAALGYTGQIGPLDGEVGTR